MYVDFGHCGADPCSAEQREQETESRKDVSLPELKKSPSWTSAHVGMPKILGLAYIYFHEGKVQSTAIQEINAGANTHSVYEHTFLPHPSIFWSIYPTHLKHPTISKSNSWKEENAIIPPVTQQLSGTAW